jgi:uncharacterized membrane protein
VSDPGPYYRPAGVGYRPPPRRFRWFPVIVAVVFIAVASFLLLILFYPASFGLSSPSSSGRYYPFGGFFFLFFILIIGFFIVRVAFWGTRASRYDQGYYQRGGGGGVNRPAMIARMRYARGEITREQYDQIMQDLERRPPTP